MSPIPQTMFWNAFSLIRIFEFRLHFPWSLFLRARSTTSQHWFRRKVYWRIYASLGLKKITEWNARPNVRISYIKKYYILKLYIIAQNYMNRKSFEKKKKSRPIRHQAITWTNAVLLSIGTLGTNFSEIWIEIPKISFVKKHLKKIVCEVAAILSMGRWGSLVTDDL